MILIFLFISFFPKLSAFFFLFVALILFERQSDSKKERERKIVLPSVGSPQETVTMARGRTGWDRQGRTQSGTPLWVRWIHLTYSCCLSLCASAENYTRTRNTRAQELQYPPSILRTILGAAPNACPKMYACP